MIVETIENALSNAWPMLVIFLSIVVIVRITYLSSNSRKVVLYEEVLSFFFIVYVLLLFELLTSTESGSFGSNLIPFTEITRYPIGSKLFFFNVIGNIIIFMPFGFYVSYYCKLKHIVPIFLISAVTSAIVEIVQFKIGRAFDVDDIILNVLGGVIGYLIYIGLNAIKKRLPRFFRNEIFINVVVLLLSAGVVYLFYHYIGFGWF